MEKIVKTGRTAVFTLDGTECRLTFSQKYRGFDIENRSDGDILVSFRSGSVEGDDETMTIPAGGSFNFMQMYETDTVYLTGTGKVAVAAKNDSNPNFKSSQGGGDSGTASGSVVGLQIGKYIDEPVSACVSVSTLPYEFYSSSAVIYNNEIHILGGGVSDNRTKHYKYNGSAWESVSTLPYEFYNGSAVLYNNKIHILGGGVSNNRTNHYYIKDDIRHISAMLPKGTHIMISDDEDIYYTANATKIASNIAEAAETGFVELLATLSETPKGYLTFY